MSAEQQQTALDADRLGQVAYQVRSDWWRSGVGMGLVGWTTLPNEEQEHYRGVGRAVARAALDAVVAHLTADLAADTDVYRMAWGQGYEDALNEVVELAAGITGEGKE